MTTCPNHCTCCCPPPASPETLGSLAVATLAYSLRTFDAVDAERFARIFIELDSAGLLGTAVSA